MPTLSATLAGRIAGLTKNHGPDDPRIPQVRRELAEANISRYIQAEVAKAPALTSDQVDRLTALLKRGVA